MSSYSNHLNNLGALALEKGDLRFATQLFKEALDATLSKSKDGSSVLNNSVTMSRYQIDRLGEAQAQIYGTISSFVPQKENSCTGAFVYQKAFLIEEGDYGAKECGHNETVPKSDEHACPSRTIASATLLFNLGLVYHLKGQFCVGRTDQILHHATGFYKMALELVKPLLHSDDSHAVDSKLVMAIMNNLGQIYCEQGEYHLSKMCFSRLSVILICMTMSGSHSQIASSDWAGLIMNTMVIHDLRSAPAA